MNSPILEMKNLRVAFQKDNCVIQAVDGVDLTINKGEKCGLIGESGSGKSVTGLSIMRLHAGNVRFEADCIKLEGQDLLHLTERELRRLRGKKVSMVFQDPMTSLNPSMTVGDQIAENILIHEQVMRKSVEKRVVDLLEMVAIPDAHQAKKRYPHEFSGGMRQRAMIAMALSCSPSLLIADEPTTALDMTIQAAILDLINKLAEEAKASTLIITHDFGVVAEICDTVYVMYGGKIVENGSVKNILAEAKHPYTQGLLNCLIPAEREVEKLDVIPGTVPTPDNLPVGCSFHPRCKYFTKRCAEGIPVLKEVGKGHFVRCFLFL